MSDASKSRQEVSYIDDDMQMERVSLRLSKVQRDQIKTLSERLQLDETNVIRLAITRLAQLEGIIKGTPIMEILREESAKRESV